MDGDNIGPRRTGLLASTGAGLPAIRRTGLLTVTVAVLVAACSSAAPPPGPVAGGSARYRQALAYSQCMRAHGVADFPDPDASGDIIQHSSGGQAPDSGPGAQAADSSCHHLLPGGGAPSTAASRRAVSRLLRLAVCMRAHGEPDFPDPTVAAPSGANSVSLPGNITLGLGAAGINVGSPRFQAAARACRSLAPPGLFSQTQAGQ